MIHAQYDSAGDFKEGLAAVRIGNSKEGKFGHIDKNGNFVIQPQFDAADGLNYVIIELCDVDLLNQTRDEEYWRSKVD